MICRPNNQPSMTQEIEATVSWMDAQHALTVGTPLLLKHTTKVVRATVEALHYKMDINGLRRDESATELALNDIGRIRLHTTEALAIDDYQLNRATGSFILINPHTNLTVGAGTVNSQLTRPQSQRGAPHRQAHGRGALPPSRGAGATVLFTGLSGSGKSTLASAVEEILVKRGQPAFMVDGTTFVTTSAVTSASRPKTGREPRRAGRWRVSWPRTGRSAPLPDQSVRRRASQAARGPRRHGDGLLRVLR